MIGISNEFNEVCKDILNEEIKNKLKEIFIKEFEEKLKENMQKTTQRISRQHK
jgi:hypothetical protein